MSERDIKESLRDRKTVPRSVRRNLLTVTKLSVYYNESTKLKTWTPVFFGHHQDTFAYLLESRFSTSGKTGSFWGVDPQFQSLSGKPVVATRSLSSNYKMHEGSSRNKNRLDSKSTLLDADLTDQTVRIQIRSARFQGVKMNSTTGFNSRRSLAGTSYDAVPWRERL